MTDARSRPGAAQRRRGAAQRVAAAEQYCRRRVSDAAIDSARAHHSARFLRATRAKRCFGAALPLACAKSRSAALTAARRVIPAPGFTSSSISASRSTAKTIVSGQWLCVVWRGRSGVGWVWGGSQRGCKRGLRVAVGLM